MDMRVDAARDHDLARRVDHATRTERGEAAWRADRGNALAGHPDIGRLRTRRKDGETA
jgi:hypothetical protein